MPAGSASDSARSSADEGEDAEAVVADMAVALDPGIVASTGPRYYGFVIGGALPAASAADLLTTAWNQNGALHALSPAAAAAEEIAGEWMLDLLGLPADASVGLPTGAGLGNAVGMAAARHRLLQRTGWDVEAAGLYGAPEIVVIIGDEAHATVLTALQYLGFGRDRVTRVATDEQGRMRADALRTALAALDPQSPLLVIAQAGNVNTGGFDPVGEIADVLAEHPNAWLHVDGAFGLWAAVSPDLRHLVAGRREGRLVVDRRPQVAERGLRLRLRGGPRPGGAPLGHGGHRRLPHAQRPARVVGVRVRQLATRSRLRPVRHHPLARTRRHPRDGRTLLPAGAPHGRSAGRRLAWRS